MTPGAEPTAGTGGRADRFVDVLALDDLPVGGRCVVLLDSVRVLLCRTQHEIHAMVDACPHALQPLSGGTVREGTIQCARHGACFDLASGRPVNAVTDRALTLYRVRLRGGRVEIAAPAT